MWLIFAGDLTSIAQTIADALSFLPPWTVLLLVLIAAMVAAWLLHVVAMRIVRRFSHGRLTYLRSVLDESRHAFRFAIVVIALAIALPTAPIGSDTESLVARLLLFGTICLLGWIALIALHIGSDLYLARFRLDVGDSLLARKQLTQVRLLVRAIDTVIIVLTAGFALMTFDAVRQYGVSLFASAGVAGIIAGLAARPVLSNLFAGVQLAFTQPIRLEDAVTVENEYGWIEEITSTYVVIRIWDMRRLIVPLSYFIEKPFYNWTRQLPTTLGSVIFFVDYAAPLDVIRVKAAEIVALTKQDKPRVTSVQVINMRPDGMEVRVMVDSDSYATTGNVCADLREKMIAFLHAQHPEALPRHRNEIIDSAERKPGNQAPPSPAERSS